MTQMTFSEVEEAAAAAMMTAFSVQIRNAEVVIESRRSL